MITVLDMAETDTRLHKESVREQAGPCPDTSCRCQTNGFRVKWNGEKWVFMCRGCWDSEEYLSEKNRKRGWGDEIDFLRHYRGMTFQQAKAYLDEQGNEFQQTRRPEGSVGFQSPEKQKEIVAIVKEYAERLWSSDDTLALDYAHSRGLRDETIRKTSLGYSLKGGIPRLIIPSYSRELQRFTAIYRRDLRPDSDERWKDAPGGTKSELYQAESLERKLPTVLTEGAIDALSIAQDCVDLVNVVATGGADCGKQVKWLARLACMPLILVAFDADAAGDEHADWWVKRLKNARRLRPFLHDVNDILVQGWDLRHWILDTIASQEDDLHCRVCGDGVEYYSSEGVPYCGLHWPLKREQLAS